MHFANDLTLVVPAHIRKTLLEAAQAAQTTPESVGQVWRANSSERLDVWFGGQARAHFPRLTSAKLASYQRQRLFDRSGQFNFSRLLTSHPDSALPGSCSYSTWDLQAISDGLQPAVEALADEPVVNAMGSLLSCWWRAERRGITLHSRVGTGRPKTSSHTTTTGTVWSWPIHHWSKATARSL